MHIRSKYNLFFMAFIIQSFVTFNAYASCLTSEPECEGQKTFKNDETFTRCFTLFWEEGHRNFCLKQGETATYQVYHGNEFCFIDKDEHPPEDCVRFWINTD